MKKYTPLNQRGFDHAVLAIACVVLVGVIGSAFIVASHALTTVWKGDLEAFSASSGYCMTSGGTTKGSKVVLSPCTNPSDNKQVWSRNNIRTATVMGVARVQEFTLQSSAGTTECLNDPYGSTKNGTQLQVYTCSSNDKNNIWVWGGNLTGKGLSSHQIVNLATVSGNTGLCLDDTSGAKTTGNKVQMYSCKTSGQTNQSWFQTSVQGGSGSTGGSGGSGGTGGGTVSTCTKPTWNSSDAEAAQPFGSDNVWWVNNDAWSGSHGPQSIYACSQSSWYAVSNQKDNGGQVETYPDTEYDIAGRGNAKKTIAQTNTITSTFAENYPAAGSWDAAYDLWLNNWGTEIMIWNQWTGTQKYWPSDKSITVNLNGVPYWFQNNGGELMFFRQNMVSSGSVDILAAYKYLVSKGLVKSSDVPTQLEYGVEICSTSGNETFPTTGVNFTVN